MNIPENYIIHDTRILKDFKGITICGYKRKDVINAYQNSMINNKIEDAIRWCVELHSTGLNNIIWDSLKILYIKYIHVNNPKFFFYLLKREKDYINIISKYPKNHEIFSRNNQEIRNLYSELTSITTIIKKNNIFLPKSLPVINNLSFEKFDIQKRMISKNLDKILDYVFNTTTNNMKLALNEIINNLYMINGTFENCIYWYTWLEKTENLKKKEPNILFDNKSIIEDKYIDHWIFIIWKILLDYNYELLEKYTHIYLKKLHSEYKKNFKLSQISKKKYYLFIAFYIIKKDIKWNINIFQQEHLIIQTNININKMYENIINNIESNLSIENKKILYKKYNDLLYNDKNRTILKKIKNTNLDDEINVVVFSNNHEYKSLLDMRNNEDNIEEKKEKKENLISKNMTNRDINREKEEVVDKKLSVLSEFITYKKEKENKPKNVLEYYKDESISTSIKNINFTKRK